MLPEGWKLGDFGSIGKWTGGGTPSKANDHFWTGGTIPWVSPKDMTSGKICGTEDYITPEAIKNSATRIYPAGSVMIVTRSGILRKKLPVAIAELPITVNQDLKVLPYNKQFSPEYVYNYILCFNNEILNTCAKEGTTVESIDTNSFLGFPIKLPPLPEQKKIAAILSTWDRAIEGTEKLLANSQQQKKALMQQLLTGKKRLPGFTGEWVTKTFSDLFILKIGGTPARSNTAYWDIDKTTENRWVAISDLKSSKIRSTSEHISDLGAQNSNCSLIPKGTIILSFKLTIGKKAILLEDCYTNEAICALIIKDKKLADTRYIYQALDNVNYEEEIDQAVKGKTLNKEKLARLRMSVPPVPEQQAIAGVLTTADEEITAIESDLSRLRQEKKALMQQLLTGKRRVKVD